MALEAEQLFSLGNLLALVGWAILILAPRRIVPVLWLPQFLIPGLLGLAYAALILTGFTQSGGDFSSIEGVRTLFASDAALVAGWLHYLAFDLFVGSWIARRSDEAGIARLLQAPMLLATFMFGPIGLALFLLTRTALATRPQDGGDGTRLFGFFANETPTRALIMLGLFLGALAIVTAVAVPFETRTLNGINPWIKPLKFDLSIMLHTFTLAILIQQMTPARRSGLVMQGLTGAFLAAALLENVYITIQAMRGRHSHFNFDTMLEAALYALMGIGALVLVLVPLVIGFMIARQGDDDRSGYRLGTVLGLVSGAVLTIVFAGYMSNSGSHFVGSPGASDAGGLPLLGWSTTIPDLRPAHFFALHAMQIVPLAGWLADRAVPALARPLVWGVTVANAALATWLFVNALSGNPLPGF